MSLLRPGTVSIAPLGPPLRQCDNGITPVKLSRGPARRVQKGMPTLPDHNDMSSRRCNGVHPGELLLTGSRFGCKCRRMRNPKLVHNNRDNRVALNSHDGFIERGDVPYENAVASSLYGSLAGASFVPDSGFLLSCRKGISRTIQ